MTQKAKKTKKATTPEISDSRTCDVLTSWFTILATIGWGSGLGGDGVRALGGKEPTTEVAKNNRKQQAPPTITTLLSSSSVSPCPMRHRLPQHTRNAIIRNMMK